MTDTQTYLASASQVDTYNDCPRKWGFYKIECIRGEQNRFAARGEELHLIAENFARDGTPPPNTDAGKVFKAGLIYLPAPGTCLGVEEKFVFYPEGEEFGFSGRKDWVEKTPSNLVRIGDHKTTTDEKWIKSVEALRVHPQPVIYAAHTLTEYPWLPLVDFRWLYYIWEPRRPHASPRDFRLSKAEIEDGFGKILENCRQMAAWFKQGVRANELPYNVDTCDKYGGCSYREHCGLTPQERLRGIMSQLSLKEKLMARKAGGNGSSGEAATLAPTTMTTIAAVTTAATAAPAPEATAEKKPAGGTSMLDRMKSYKTGKTADAVAAPATVAPVAPIAVAEPVKPIVKVSAESAEVLAVACLQISDGFAAIATHFRGPTYKKG